MIGIDMKVGPEMHELDCRFDDDKWVHMYNRCIWEPRHQVLLCRNVRVGIDDVDDAEIKSKGTIFMMRFDQNSHKFDW